jgi:mercuric ion transport protein
MNDKNLLKAGIVGSVATGLCCVTPVLVIALGALGFSAAVGWLDFVLLPLLAGFLGLTGYAWHRRRRASS